MEPILQAGDQAPEFALTSHEGEIVRLSDFKGSKLLVYFYPKADTPGCTKQACSVSESLTALRRAGVEAVGISPDPPKALEDFHRKYHLGFRLLSDPEHQSAEAYGVWGEKSMYGKTYMGIIRSAFLIDEDGVLLGTAYKINPGDTVTFVQERLAG